MDRFGVEEVENFIDCCLSIEDLIDIHSPFIKRRDDDDRYDFRDTATTKRTTHRRPARFQAKDYMDSFVNPPRRMAARSRAEAATEQQKKAATSRRSRCAT